MKRKRETKTDGGEICKLGSEWASKRRPPSTDERGLSTLGYKFMSSRPSARKARLSLPNFHTVNGNNRTPSERPQQQQQQQHGYGDRADDEENDTEGDWISQLGAKYMTRKKLYEARSSPLLDCSAHFSPREHELELDNELDNAWIADFGMQWMQRRCRTRKGQYKVHDDAWICELGFQWMSHAREREHANQTWLSDLSTQYMTRRKRELDRGIEELGLTAYRGFLERDPSTDGSLWETRRKLQYSDPDAKRSKNNGHGCQPVDKHEMDARSTSQAGVVNNGVNASQAETQASDEHHVLNHVEQEAKLIDDTENSACRLSLLPQLIVDSEFGLLDRENEVGAANSDEFQVLEFDPLGYLEPTEYVNLDNDDDSSSSSS